MTDQRSLDEKLLDLLKTAQESPLPPNKWGNSAIPGAEKPADTMYDLAQREFELNRQEYEQEMAELSKPEDDQEEWKDLMRETGRM